MDKLAPAASAGGVNVQGAEVAIGGDVAGRDKINQTIIHAAPGATVVVNPPDSGPPP